MTQPYPHDRSQVTRTRLPRVTGMLSGFAGGQMISILLTGCTSFLISLMAGTHSLGQYAVVTSTSSISSYLGSLGLPDAATWATANRLPKVWYLRNILITSLATIAISSVISVVILRGYSNSLQLATIVISLCLTLERTSISSLLGLESDRAFLRTRIVPPAAIFLLTIAFLGIDRQANSAVFALSAAHLMSAAFACAVWIRQVTSEQSNHRFETESSIRDIAKSIRRASFVNGLSLNILTRIDLLALAHLQNTQPIGEYALGITLAEAASFPSQSAVLHRLRTQMRNQAHRSLFGVTLASCGSLAVSIPLFLYLSASSDLTMVQRTIVFGIQIVGSLLLISAQILHVELTSRGQVTSGLFVLSVAGIEAFFISFLSTQLSEGSHFALLTAAAAVSTSSYMLAAGGLWSLRRRLSKVSNDA